MDSAGASPNESWIRGAPNLKSPAKAMALIHPSGSVLAGLPDNGRNAASGQSQVPTPNALGIGALRD